MIKTRIAKVWGMLSASVWLLGISLNVCAEVPAFGASSEPRCSSDTFADAARHADAATFSLLQSRGVSPDLNRKASGEQLSSLSRTLNSKLLIFTHEKGVLCGYLIDFSGSKPVIDVKYSVGELSEITRLVTDSHFAFGIQQLQATRAPQRLRGARAIARQEPMAGVSEKAFRELGMRLFPSGLASRLPVQGQLMILPTGILATLPFSAMVPAQATDPVSEQVVLSILPALSVSDQARGNSNLSVTWNGTSGDRAFVVGNPDFTQHKDWQFLPLPGAEAEARSVAAALPGWAYFGREATADRFFSHAKEADLIYLATHAISSETEALDESFVVLSDRLVTPREIQHGKFNAGLAVLSACQTGLGVPHDGGTIGLARAFYLAGVPGVIMSLWNVDDEATKALMASFMNHLKSKAPQEALSLAMRERRQVDPNPAKWASFMYFGFPMVSNSEPK